MTMAPLSWKVLTMASLEGTRGPGRTSKQVGCAEMRLSSATNLPMKPVAPMMRTRPLVGMAGGEVTMLLEY